MLAWEDTKKSYDVRREEQNLKKIKRGGGEFEEMYGHKHEK